MPGYIPDGYTREDGHIAESLPEASGETQHESLSFTYRSATRQELCTLNGAIRIAMKNSDIDPTCEFKAEQAACKFVADHIVSWDLKQVGTHPVDVSAKAVERINPILFSKLYSIVRGERVSDRRPEAKDDPKSEADLLGNSPRVSG